MMPANVKANIKQERDKRSGGGCILLFFFKKYHQNLKYNVKEGVFFI